MSSVAATPLAIMARYFSLEVYDAASTDEQLAELYALRYRVYCQERDFLNPADYPDGLESDIDDARSAHFAVRNGEGEVVGTSRLVLGDQARAFPFELHCSASAEFEPPPASEAAEVSRLAVSKSYRRRVGDTLYGVNEEEIKRDPETSLPGTRHRRANAPLLVLGIYRQMYRYSRDNGIRYWYAAMEKSLARVLRVYGFVFTPIGPVQDYYGPVTPFIGDLAKLEEQLEAKNPDLMQWFRHGP